MHWHFRLEDSSRKGDSCFFHPETLQSKGFSNSIFSFSFCVSGYLYLVSRKFTVAAEYLLEKCKTDLPNLRWACSARNMTKAESVLQTLSETVTNSTLPTILRVDLLCKTPEEESKLRSIVQSTKVCLTCSGPFELYGKKLVQMCAEEGVHYGDITGETDFVREMISKYDDVARETGACILPHCGNDCIPSDLTIFEMNKFAKEKGFELKEVQLYEVRHKHWETSIG